MGDPSPAGKDAGNRVDGDQEIKDAWISDGTRQRCLSGSVSANSCSSPRTGFPLSIAPHLAAHLAALALALGLDAACGYPSALYRTIRHPVVWAGTLIAALDRHLNRPELGFRQRRARGIAAVLVLLLAALLPALALEAVARGAAGIVLLALLTSPLLAQRSLHDHVRAVADALERGGLAAGREAVSHIVGRNPAFLDEAGVARAAIESLAENFSDGVVAPAFWAAALGLPGIAAYKAVNTADSMIGHRTERHAAFGWAAARLDDLINLPGSRLAALWLILAACLLPGASPAKAARGMRRDARHHRSPNAGWPEAAMAGALGLRLNGPRVYGDARVEDAWMGDGRDNATAADVRRALRLYRLACAINLGAVLAALAVV